VILITGGTGFLGATLIEQLIRSGQSVVAIKRKDSSIPARLANSPFIRWVDADLTDFFSLEDAFVGIQQVYHCAAIVSFQKRLAKQMQHINVTGTANIVHLCLEKGVRLLHVSSIAALGSSKTGAPVSEADKWEYDKHISAYALSKYYGEMEVWRGIAEGLDAVIVNPSVIIGKHAGKKGSGAIFENVRKGLKFYPKGTLGLIDVEDVAQLMRMLMENTAISAERFILNNVNIKSQDLLIQVSALLQKDPPQIATSNLLLSIAWRVAAISSFFGGKDSSFTKDTARSANAILHFDNSKIQQAIAYEYKPLEQTLEEICSSIST